MTDPTPRRPMDRWAVLAAIRDGATDVDQLATRFGVHAGSGTLRKLIYRLHQAGFITATIGDNPTFAAVRFADDAGGDRQAVTAELDYWLADMLPDGADRHVLANTKEWLTRATFERVSPESLPLYLGYKVMQGTHPETIVGVRHVAGGSRAEIAVADPDRIAGQRIAFTADQPITVYGPPAPLAWLPTDGTGPTWESHDYEDRVKMLVSTGTVNAARADTDAPRQELHLLLPVGPYRVNHDAADLAIFAARTVDTVTVLTGPFQARLVGPDGTVGEPFTPYHVTDDDMQAWWGNARGNRPRLDAAATLVAVAGGLDDARNAIIEALPEHHPAVADLRGDMRAAGYSQVLRELSLDPRVFRAVAALDWALAYADQGNVGKVLDFAGRVREFLAIDAPRGADVEDTTLVWVFADDRVGSGTVRELARSVEHAQLAGEDGPGHVYTAYEGDLVEVDVRCESSGYGEDDFATMLLHVMLPGGVVVTGSWRADGRT